MKRTILAAAATAALLPLSLAAPAHATSGDFEAGVYYEALGGVSQGTIQSRCGCTGSTTTMDGNDKKVAYTADNASFSWDITLVIIHYHQDSAGVWRARNYGDGTGGKERYSPTRAPYQFFDDVDA